MNRCESVVFASGFFHLGFVAELEFVNARQSLYSLVHCPCRLKVSYSLLVKDKPCEHFLVHIALCFGREGVVDISHGCNCCLVGELHLLRLRQSCRSFVKGLGCVKVLELGFGCFELCQSISGNIALCFPAEIVVGFSCRLDLFSAFCRVGHSAYGVYEFFHVLGFYPGYVVKRLDKSQHFFGFGACEVVLLLIRESFVVLLGVFDGCFVVSRHLVGFGKSGKLFFKAVDFFEALYFGFELFELFKVGYFFFFAFTECFVGSSCGFHRRRLRFVFFVAYAARELVNESLYMVGSRVAAHHMQHIPCAVVGLGVAGLVVHGRP